MRARWLGVVVVCLVALLFAFLARAAPAPSENFASWEENYASEQVERIERIDLELRMIANEKARLDAERLALQAERACTAKAKSRPAMQRCAVPRP